MKELENTVFGLMVVTIIAMPCIALVKMFSIGIDFGNTLEFLTFSFLVFWILFLSWLLGNVLFPDEEESED